jgi:hypothetical protein
MFCEIPVASVPAFSMQAPVSEKSQKSEKSMVCELPASNGLIAMMDKFFGLSKSI